MHEAISRFLEAVRHAAPGTEVFTDEEDRLIFSHGCYPREYKWILQGKYPHMADAVLAPENETEVAAAVVAANRFHIGIIPYGGGSGIVGGTIPDKGRVILDTKRLTGFSINHCNLTARAGAGLSGAEFENALNRHGYTSGHFPQSFQSACMGGMAATNAIGTFSTKYGKMDDMVTALNVVLPTGAILGTHTAPKRSSGTDLMRIFLGSEGVYGIITEVEMKIYPLAEQRVFAAYTFPSTEDGLNAVRGIVQRGLRPAVVRLYDETEAEHKMAHYRFERGFALLLLVFEGFAEMTGLEARQAHSICLAGFGRYKGGSAAREWHAARFSTKKMLDYDARRGCTADAVEVAAPWDRIGNVWRAMRRALAPLCEVVDCHFSHVYHNGASVYVIFHADTGGDDRAGEQRYRECLRVACETSARYGGNISHHHGIGTAKAEFLRLEHGESGVGVLRDMKKALDPGGVMNQGVLGL